jgi:hypothetical protein
MCLRAAHSRKCGSSSAAADVAAQLGWGPWSLVVHFGTPSYAQRELARTMRALLPGAYVVGCSPAGELTGRDASAGSLVALGLGEEDVRELAVATVDDVRDPAAVGRAVDRLERPFGDLRGLDPAMHVGILLLDGVRGADASVAEILHARAGSLFCGLAPGCGLTSGRAWIHVNGTCRCGGAALVVLRAECARYASTTRRFVRRAPALLAADASHRLVEAP